MKIIVFYLNFIITDMIAIFPARYVSNICVAVHVHLIPWYIMFMFFVTSDEFSKTGVFL